MDSEEDTDCIDIDDIVDSVDESVSDEECLFFDLDFLDFLDGSLSFSLCLSDLDLDDDDEE